MEEAGACEFPSDLDEAKTAGVSTEQQTAVTARDGEKQVPLAVGRGTGPTDSQSPREAETPWRLF